MSRGTKTPGPRRQPESALLLVVSLHRYFSYMVAVGLMVVWPSLRGDAPPFTNTVALGVVGAYVMVRAFLPLRPRPGSLPSYAFLALDLGMALGPLLVTGGLASGLLLYSQTPVLTAALLMEEAVALGLAGISTVVLLVAHTTGWADAWILNDNYLAIFLLYTIAAALVAAVPYRANVNLRRRLEGEATAGERRRLRRQIHDNLAQQIGTLNLQAKTLTESLQTQPPEEVTRQVLSLQETLQQAYSNLRDYLDILGLPPTLPLSSALGELARDFSARSGIPLDTAIARDRLNIPPLAEVEVLAVAQEALNNIQRHSRARRARVALISSASAVELLIEDYGQGFDPDTASAPGHYGLTGMRERAQEIGATLTVVSVPGKGTQVRLLLPR